MPGGADEKTGCWNQEMSASDWVSSHTGVTRGMLEHVHYYEPYIDRSTTDPMSPSHSQDQKKQTAAIIITSANYQIHDALRGV